MTDICIHCKKPILEDEECFCGDPDKDQHYDCWRAAGGRTRYDDIQDTRKKLTELDKSMHNNLNLLRDRLRRL